MRFLRRRRELKIRRLKESGRVAAAERPAPRRLRSLLGHNQAAAANGSGMPIEGQTQPTEPQDRRWRVFAAGKNKR